MVPDSLVVRVSNGVCWINDARAEYTPAFQLNQYFFFSWVINSYSMGPLVKLKHSFWGYILTYYVLQYFLIASGPFKETGVFLHIGFEAAALRNRKENPEPLSGREWRIKSKCNPERGEKTSAWTILDLEGNIPWNHEAISCRGKLAVTFCGRGWAMSHFIILAKKQDRASCWSVGDTARWIRRFKPFQLQ